MNDREICRAYNRAGNLRQKIRDLAEQHNTTVETIREVLRRNGYAPPVVPSAGSFPHASPVPAPEPIVSPTPRLSNSSLEKALHLIALVEEGRPLEKIAETLGLTFGQAMTLVARLCTYCEEYIAQSEIEGASS